MKKNKKKVKKYNKNIFSKRKYSKRKYSKKKYSKRKYSKRKYSKRKYSKRKYNYKIRKNSKKNMKGGAYKTVSAPALQPSAPPAWLLQSAPEPAPMASTSVVSEPQDETGDVDPSAPPAPMASTPSVVSEPQDETGGKQIFVKNLEQLRDLLQELKNGLVTVNVLGQHGEFWNTVDEKGIEDLIIVNIVPVGGEGRSVGYTDLSLTREFLHKNDISLLLYEAYSESSSEGGGEYLTDENGCFTPFCLKFRNRFLENRREGSPEDMSWMFELNEFRINFAVSEKKLGVTEFNDNWFNDAETDENTMFVSICCTLNSDSTPNIILVPFSLLSLPKVNNPAINVSGYLYSNIILAVNKLLIESGFEGKKVFTYNACRVFRPRHTPEEREKAMILENKEGLDVSLYCFLKDHTDKFELFRKYNIIDWTSLYRLAYYLELYMNIHSDSQFSNNFFINSVSLLLSDETRRKYINYLFVALEFGKLEEFFKEFDYRTIAEEARPYSEFFERNGLFTYEALDLVKGGKDNTVQISTFILLNDLFKILGDWNLESFYIEGKVRLYARSDAGDFPLEDEEVIKALESWKIMPGGWEMKFDSGSKRIYFQNNSEHTTQWSLPDVVVNARLPEAGRGR